MSLVSRGPPRVAIAYPPKNSMFNAGRSEKSIKCHGSVVKAIVDHV